MADKVRKVAVEIANELFTNGSGEHARHLNLIMDGGRYVGGWCEAAVADIIERKIRAAQQNAQPMYGVLCAECGSPSWAHGAIGHDFVAPHPQVA